MTRNAFLLTAGAVALTVQPVLAQAAPAADVLEPADMSEIPPVVGAENVKGGDSGLYKPRDQLERGLWMQVDELERDLKVSPLIMHDSALNAYVRSVLCRTVGENECRNVRLYLVHTPHFNASMAPNGVMQVWSGLLLRTQNEAQLAAVLGHEYSHFENRHSVKLYRDAKSKSAAAAWLSFTVVGLIASVGLASSLYKFSREQEKEADIGGVTKIATAGYDAAEAAVIWEQLRDEMDATAAARGQKSKKDKGGLFSTHPPTAERVAYIKEQAALTPGPAGVTGAERYREALGAYWPMLVDDQLKMNDFGASAFLLDSLVKANGATPWIRYAQGELYRRRAQDGDQEKAVAFFDQAIELGGNLPEIWRGRGLALIKIGRDEEARADLAEYLVRAPEAKDISLIKMISGESE